MGYKGRNFIDEMVEEFGYDYVVGYCLCSEYKLRKLAKEECDYEKKNALLKSARKFSNDVKRLAKERFDYGL